MAQVATTIGYGDIVPSSTGGMYFMAAYVLFSGLFIAGSFLEAADRLADEQQRHADEVLGKLFEDGDPITESTCERLQGVILSALMFFLALLLWALFYSHYFCDLLLMFIDAGDWTDDWCEDMTFLRALYFGVISLTTVGFGDVVPTTKWGRVFSALLCFLGIATYFNLVGAIANKVLNQKQVDWIYIINARDWELMDDDRSGEVTIYEFTMFMLRRYNLVSQEVLDALVKNFEQLDADGSGVISIDDLAHLLEKQRAPARRVTAYPFALESMAS
jgi:voltage-gated potassium channel Kch